MSMPVQQQTEKVEKEFKRKSTIYNDESFDEEMKESDLEENNE